MRKNKGSELSVKLDWIAFCINECDFIQALDYMGFCYNEFKDLRHGGRGYRNMLQHNSFDINVYFNGSADMGTHFEVKGSAVYGFIDLVVRRKFGSRNPFDGRLTIDYDLNDVREIFKLILNNGWFNRLDVAIDDIDTGFYSCEKLQQLLENRQYVAKFKSFDCFKSKETSGKLKGYTVYLGSKINSDMYVRVYDKFLEQQKKTDKLDCVSWVRWEIVLKNEKADLFTGYVVDGIDFGCCIRSVLSNYMRLIKIDDVNRSRCSVLPKWKRFIDSVESLSLSIPREGRTVGKARNWIERQVMPTLSGLIYAYQGDMSFIYNNMQEHFNRLKLSDQEMFRKYLEEINDN